MGITQPKNLYHQSDIIMTEDINKLSKEEISKLEESYVSTERDDGSIRFLSNEKIKKLEAGEFLEESEEVYKLDPNKGVNLDLLDKNKYLPPQKVSNLFHIGKITEEYIEDIKAKAEEGKKTKR